MRPSWHALRATPMNAAAALPVEETVMNDKLRKMLADEGARFEVIMHPEAYTAQERATACYITRRRRSPVRGSFFRE